MRLIFEPNANHDRKDVFDRSSLWMNASADGFEVLDVIANGPASTAGLKVGDKIVAVDGKSWQQVSLPVLRQRFKTDAPQTKVRLTVQSRESKREVVLELRDQV